MSKADVTERLLAQIWSRQLVDAEKLATGDGEAVEVLCPGKENRDEGPDFLGAVICTGVGGLLRGDIEVHSRASDWRSHGHHRDPHYNGVILQVVWDGDGVAVLESGGAVPTLSLRRCLRGSLDDVRRWAALPAKPSEPCYNAREWLGDEAMGILLDEAGEERFLLKARWFADRMGEESPGQALYRGLMRALGYARNKESFEALACLMPLAVLEASCRGRPATQRVRTLKALLLGKAGLLPASGEPDLARLWRSLGDGEEMSPSRWHVFRVRPDNHPVRRLAGAAHLLARFTDEGLVDGVLGLVAQPDATPARLEWGFLVGPPVSSSGESSLIGWGRAREIVINVILPFGFAWGQASGEEALVERALRLYRGYPRAGENAVTRDLSNLLFGGEPSRLAGSALRQQGLIHLERTFCCRRGCINCPVAAASHSRALAA